MSVYEEVKRNQLVTEVDIQTQAGLDDYQVQLSDISNPTASQDNAVISGGEFLPHWNESLDFDAWVKMNIEVAGKRLLVLSGNSNLNSVSDGEEVFDFFDTFTSLDWATKWSSASQASYSAANNRLRLADIDATTNHIVTQNTYSNFVLTLKAQSDNTLSSLYCFFHPTTTWSAAGEGAIVYNNTGLNCRAYINGANNLETIVEDLNDDYTFNLTIPSSGNATSEILYTDGSQLNINTGTPANTSGYISLLEWQGNYSYVDYLYLRQYASVEPTVHFGTPKNIAVALKSLGRIG